MFILSSLASLVAQNDVQIKYGPPVNPVPLYGIQPTPEEAGWFLFLKFVPLLFLIFIISFAVGIYLHLKKSKKNAQKNTKKR